MTSCRCLPDDPRVIDQLISVTRAERHAGAHLAGISPGLSALPIVVIGVVAAAILAAIYALVTAWRSGEVSAAQARVAVASIVGQIAAGRAEGAISGEESERLLRVLAESQIPGAPRPSSSLPSWAGPVAVGVATTVLGSLVLSGIRRR